MAVKTEKNEAGIKICEALGVDPGLVHRLTVEAPAVGAPKVTLEMMDFDGKLEAVDWAEALKRAEVTVNITRVTWDA